MNASYIGTLADIAGKPGATRRDTLTIVRRLARHVCEYRDEIRQTRRAFRRQAAIERQHLPFTRHKVEELERLAREYRADLMEVARSILLAHGALLVLDKAGDAEALGFDALADLLNINRVDREQARREGWRTLSDLIAVHDLENSSERRGDEWGAGSPLYQACHVALIEFIRTAPAGALPDPFAPGEIFGPKLSPTLTVV